jgi:hypothetical protein
VTLLLAIMLCYKFQLPWPWWAASVVVYAGQLWLSRRPSADTSIQFKLDRINDTTARTEHVAMEARDAITSATAPKSR